MTKKNNINDLPKGIRLIRGAYWLLVILGLIALLGKFAGLPSVQQYSTAVMTFNAIIYTSILYVLYKKKSWIVSFILFYAYLMIVGRLALIVLADATDIKMIEQKVGNIFLAIFFMYQVIVFSRKETKRYYGEKGQTII